MVFLKDIRERFEKLHNILPDATRKFSHSLIVLGAGHAQFKIAGRILSVMGVLNGYDY